jgi:hypothetical protein
MGRKRGFFGVKSSSEKEPAARNLQLESKICSAITKRVRVKLQYEDDALARMFEPHAVYHTSKGKVCVSGNMISNPNDLSDELGAHNFEVGRLRSLSLTDTSFIPDPRFNRNDPKYRFGIICSI